MSATFAVKMPSVENSSSVEIAPSISDAKLYGAFYTDSQVADFLTQWALRDSDETVLDPSFGGGVFLRAACKRLLKLGGQPQTQVYGVEIDPVVRENIYRKLTNEFGVSLDRIITADFFALSKRDLPKIDAVIGNPPFIRYQKFSGQARAIALQRAGEAGVKLSELSSAWAPFLVHASAMVQDGGRLAVVAPMELSHASYAGPVLEFLGRSFETVTFLTFREPLFPELSEDTLLLLAENKGVHAARFRHRDLKHPGALSKLLPRNNTIIPATKALKTSEIASGNNRLIEHLLPSKTRELYRELTKSELTTRFREIADAGIGYVTGANSFFHLDAQQVKRLNIPDRFLKRIIRRSRGLAGVRFTNSDWHEHLVTGESAYLLHIKPDDDLPAEVLRYLRSGVRRKIHKTFKCSDRKPWYSVPHVRRPDAFLSYMSTRSPRLVSNDAGTYAPNSLHVVRLKDKNTGPADILSVGWQTSLCRLSCELQGHAMGGGMLKLEPREAGNVVLPFVTAIPTNIQETRDAIDRSLRTGNSDTAYRLADSLILEQQINLTKSDCKMLRDAVSLLQQRRMN